MKNQKKKNQQKKGSVFLEVALYNVFCFSLHQKQNKNATKIKYQLPTWF